MVLLSVSVGVAAFAEAPPRVGVVLGTAVNLSPQAQTDLSARVGAALRRRLVVDVTAGREVSRRLAGEPQGVVCYLERACQRRVGELLGVSELLVLNAVRAGTRLQVEPTWIDIASGRTVVRDAFQSDSVKDDLSDVLAAIAPALLPQAALRIEVPQASAPSTIHIHTATVAPTLVPIQRWVAFGIAGAALVAGGAVGLSASADHADLESAGCAAMACDPARIDSVDNKALIADVLFATAGVAAVTGAVLWWLDLPQTSAVSTGPVRTQQGWTWRLAAEF